MKKCVRCNQPAPDLPPDFGKGLCENCDILLSMLVLASGPNPHFFECKVCKGPIQADAPRRIKALMTNRGNRTPHELCWICWRLYETVKAEKQWWGE